MVYRVCAVISIIFLLFNNLKAQETATVYGIISDTLGRPIHLANVSVNGSKVAVFTNKKGTYEMQVEVSANMLLVFSSVGYKQVTKNINITPNSKTEINIQLPISFEDIEEVKVSGRYEQGANISRIEMKQYSLMPNASGNVEAIIKTMPGVASNNELSSQYSVRGGSFDENMVYVNDVEIFRPLLIRSGQQEGLSFVNPDLVSSLKFSAGGFDANYGDKMSSVLDITYKRPTQNKGSANISILGGGMHFEGVSENKKFRHLTGFRYKTTKYLLGSMDTRGEYNPTFYDIQTLLAYDLSPKLEISFLGNYAMNKYQFEPIDRETKFGTFFQRMNVRVFYEGKENDYFNTATGATTLAYRPNKQLTLKLISSVFSTREQENFDIQGQYWINEMDNKTSASVADSAGSIAVGEFLNHARNSLQATVYTNSHVGQWQTNQQKLRWGLTIENQVFHDNLNEWDYLDSAGYTIPNNTQAIVLNNTAKAINTLYSNKLYGYLQHTFNFNINEDIVYVTTGLRGNYWNVNNEMLWSPRASVSYKPNWQTDIIFRLSGGMYHQPVFYKEMRMPTGVLNKNIKAQRSYHFVLGTDYLFYAWMRPFKFSTELFYKQMENLIPYKVNNVRLIYAGKNMAKGYATGIEFKINGEFVKDAESWASLSILQSREDIIGDSYTTKGVTETPGYYPRPTDQLVNFSMFFQDYMPSYPTYKMQLNLHYGSSLPVAIPLIARYDKQTTIPAYRRVDIGFMKQLKAETDVLSEKNVFRYFKDIWIGLEIFNLLGIDNTVSYMWLKSVTNQEGIPGYFAIPNYLTSRRLNVKVTLKF